MKERVIIRKYSFCYEVINIWNSFPKYLVDADSINSIKSRLDKHSANQEVVFNWELRTNRNWRSVSLYVML